MEFSYNEIVNIINGYKKSRFVDMQVVKQIIDKITNGSRVSIKFVIAQLDKETPINYNIYKIIKEAISEFALNIMSEHSYNEKMYNNMYIAFDKDCYDDEGFDEDGYDEEGFDEDGYNRDGFDEDGYDRDGYDIAGLDKNGCSKDDDEDEDEEDGYDEDGFDEDGYNRDGFDEYGFDKDGYNRYGYDIEGYDIEGYDEDGFDEDGFDEDGFDEDGFDEDGYDRDGFVKKGFDENGYNRYDDDGDSNTVNCKIESSKIPELNNENEELMLISGVRKNGSYYIAIHGKSFDDVRSFVKIPDSVISEYKNKTEVNDIAAVIDFAIKNVHSMI